MCTKKCVEICVKRVPAGRQSTASVGGSVTSEAPLRRPNLTVGVRSPRGPRVAHQGRRNAKLKTEMKTCVKAWTNYLENLWWHTKVIEKPNTYDRHLTIWQQQHFLVSPFGLNWLLANSHHVNLRCWFTGHISPVFPSCIAPCFHKRLCNQYLLNSFQI